MIRTQEEILARIEGITDDFFGFQLEALALALDFDHAKTFLNGGTVAADWPGPVDVEKEAREYLAFAIGKIIGHRGISASRSVDKLTEYAWLLGRDDIVAAMDVAEYEQYGAPKVKAFADGMGWPFARPEDPWAEKELQRMAAGEPCKPNCEDGCDR